MKTSMQNVSVVGLKTLFNGYVEESLREELLNQIILSYYHNAPVDFSSIAKEFVEEEWLAIKFEMAVRDKLTQLKHEIGLLSKEKRLHSFHVTDLGVIIHVHS